LSASFRSDAGGPLAVQEAAIEPGNHQVRDALIAAVLALLVTAWFVARLDLHVGIPTYTAGVPQGATATSGEVSDHESR
jgi:hypothetical protein